jgi:RNA polymerase sigma-70 factor (ECF subfamily)
MHGTENDAMIGSNADGTTTVVIDEHVSDEELMAAFSRGSTDAFGELFSRYKQPLFGFFRRRVGDPALAEELTQEAFVVVLRAASHYEPSATFRTYLYAISFNLLRANRRKATFRAMFFSVDSSDREPAVRSTIDTTVLLRDAVSKLERVDREVLLLREFEELSYAEIADLLKLPLNTVRSRLFRARTALRDLLETPAPKSASKKEFGDFAEYEERV